MTRSPTPRQLHHSINDALAILTHCNLQSLSLTASTAAASRPATCSLPCRSLHEIWCTLVELFASPKWHLFCLPLTFMLAPSVFPESKLVKLVAAALPSYQYSRSRCRDSGSSIALLGFELMGIDYSPWDLR